MKMTGGEIIVNSLISYGVEYVFGIPGHGCLAIFDALRKAESEKKIKYVQAKQEMAAVHMADGYFRVSGKPCAVLTSIGAGALNTTIGLATSFADSTSVLVITGDTHVNMRGVGVLQEIERKHDSDFISCVRPITKRSWKVESISQLPRTMSRALNTMMNGRKGPAVVSVPMDVQADFMDCEIKKTSVDVMGRPCADNNTLSKAYKLMKAAKRPMIVAGGGMLYAKDSESLVTLAEMWGAGVVTTMAGKSAFPEDHELYCWHGGSKGTDVGNYLLRTADVILALGCRFADETTSSYRKGVTYNFPDTKLIHVDIDPQELGKNYACDVAVYADVSETIAQLISKFENEGAICDYKESEYFADIKNARDKWLKSLADARKTPDGIMTISKMIEVIGKIYPQEGYIVTSSGNTQAQLFQEYCFKSTGKHVTTGGFSTMGFAFPAGIGVKLADKDNPCMVVSGDGDFLMCMQELSTLLQLDIPVIYVMANNSGWMAIKDLQLDAFGKDYAFGNDFEAKGKELDIKYSKVAQDFGIWSRCVDNCPDFEDTLKEALSLNKPAFIEVMVTNKHPYSGGKAVGWWDVPIPDYIEDKAENYKLGKEEESI